MQQPAAVPSSWGGLNTRGYVSTQNGRPISAVFSFGAPSVFSIQLHLL